MAGVNALVITETGGRDQKWIGAFIKRLGMGFSFESWEWNSRAAKWDLVLSSPLADVHIMFDDEGAVGYRAVQVIYHSDLTDKRGTAQVKKDANYRKLQQAIEIAAYRADDDSDPMGKLQRFLTEQLHRKLTFDIKKVTRPDSKGRQQIELSTSKSDADKFSRYLKPFTRAGYEITEEKGSNGSVKLTVTTPQTK